jgi:hypothetical protein
MQTIDLEMSKALSDAFFNPSVPCYDSGRVVESKKPSLSRRTRLAIEREVRGGEFFSFQDWQNVGTAAAGLLGIDSVLLGLKYWIFLQPANAERKSLRRA